MAKNLYHSALVQMGTVWATITQGAKRSKYPDKPDYCALTIDNQEFYLSLENQECADVINSVVGQTVEITASGNRETATISIGAADPNAQAPQPRTAPPRTAPPQRPPPSRPPARGGAAAPPAARAPAAHTPPPAQRQRLLPEQAINQAKEFVERRAMLMEICLQAAEANLERYVQRHSETILSGHMPQVSAEMLQAHAAALFICSDKAGIGDTMPIQADNDQPPM